MRRLLALAALCAASTCLHAQVVDTTVCDILKNPQSFNGKTVRIKGTVVAGFEQFVVKGAGCGQAVDAIWLAYPEGTKAKAGPAVMLHLQPAGNFEGTSATPQRAPVTLQKDKAFKEFDSHLAAPYKSNAVCLGCNRYAVSATLVGRLDGVANAGFSRNAAGKIVGISGFGNLNAYRARLVLQSVADVSAQEVDYSNSSKVSKDDPAPPPAGNGAAALQKAAQAYGPGNPLGTQVVRAADAFGKQGEQNGVVVGFNTANQATSSSEEKAAQSSPDGVLFNCIFDSDRLKGDAMPIALAYAGTQIADIRNPKESISGTDHYTLEFHGLQGAVLAAIGMQVKTLTMPGDYLFWNQKWEPASRDNALQDALTNYLAKETLIRR